jgi:hypothetical protein
MLFNLMRNSSSTSTTCLPCPALAAELHPSTSQPRQPQTASQTVRAINPFLPDNSSHTFETASSYFYPINTTTVNHNTHKYLFTRTSILHNQKLQLHTRPITINMLVNSVVALALFTCAVSAQVNSTYIDPNTVDPQLKGRISSVFSAL